MFSAALQTSSSRSRPRSLSLLPTRSPRPPLSRRQPFRPALRRRRLPLSSSRSAPSPAQSPPQVRSRAPLRGPAVLSASHIARRLALMLNASRVSSARPSAFMRAAAYILSRTAESYLVREMLAAIQTYSPRCMELLSLHLSAGATAGTALPATTPPAVPVNNVPASSGAIAASNAASTATTVPVQAPPAAADAKSWATAIAIAYAQGDPS